MRMVRWVVVCLLLAVSVRSLEIEDVQRKVILTARVVKTTTKLSIINPNGDDHLYFTISEKLNSRLGQIYQKLAKGKRATVEFVGREQLVEEFQSVPQDVVGYKVSLADKQTTVELLCQFGNAYDPLPKHAGFNAEQLLSYIDSSILLSPYSIESQSTQFLIPKNSLKNSNGVTTKSEGVLEAIVSKPQAPFTEPELDVHIHYKMDTHLGAFQSVHRLLELSHWGAVAVQEKYKFLNRAAAMEGEFNRWELSRLTGSMMGRRRPGMRYPEHKGCFQLETRLPKDVYEVEYFDEIGNISTSYGRRNKDYALVQLEPRYPVLGGWKADWRLEYKLPTHSVVSRVGTDHVYRLSVPLGPGFSQIFTESLKVDIALPQGASNIRVTVPRSLITPIEETVYWGWLDLVKPRPLLRLNVGAYSLDTADLLQHNVQVEYHYRPGVSDFRKLVVIVLLAFIPFGLVISLSRTDFRFWSKRLSLSSQSEDLIKEVIKTATTINTLSEQFWNAMGTAKTESELIEAKVLWGVQHSSLMVKLAGLAALARDASALTHEERVFVFAVVEEVKSAIVSLEGVSDNAKVAQVGGVEWTAKNALQKLLGSVFVAEKATKIKKT